MTEPRMREIYVIPLNWSEQEIGFIDVMTAYNFSESTFSRNSLN